MSLHKLTKKKHDKQKTCFLTCYDYTFARLLARTPLDGLLIGDSCAMVMHGYPNTTFAHVEMIATHTQAVTKGAPNLFRIADLPFMSYRGERTQTMQAVTQLIQAGAEAVKLEGAKGNLSTINWIVDSGVPVIGHIGMTPQHVCYLGGFKRPKDLPAIQNQLQKDALALQEAGCSALVLECVQANTARMITENLTIPTIGIGSGPYTDGQILVLHDMLGFNTDFKPKFLKHYHQGEKAIIETIHTYCQEVSKQHYPELDKHSYASKSLS